MAVPRVSSKLPPNIDTTKAPIAFGRRALPKLNEELQDTELLTRQRALMALCDLVHDPEHAYEAINQGFLETLKGLISDEDSTVRRKTTEVLYIMASHNVGRTAFIKQCVIPTLAHLLNDPVVIVRWNMHYSLKLISEMPNGAICVVESGLVPSLVLKLSSEPEEIQVLILETLWGCLRTEAFEALALGAVRVFKENLSHPDARIRSGATQALMAISIPLQGKNMVLEEDVFPDLVLLLEDEDPEVRANAAGTLMFAAITTPGKSRALEAGALEPLLRLRGAPERKGRLYALKTLNTLAEAPQGCSTFLPRPLASAPGAQPGAAPIAHQLIQWEPQPSTKKSLPGVQSPKGEASRLGWGVPQGQAE